MPAGKPSTLTFRISPSLKDALGTAAEREQLSIANMVEALIRDPCGRNGITIREQQALLLGDRRRPRATPR